MRTFNPTLAVQQVCLVCGEPCTSQPVEVDAAVSVEIRCKLCGWTAKVTVSSSLTVNSICACKDCGAGGGDHTRDCFWAPDGEGAP